LASAAACTRWVISASSESSSAGFTERRSMVNQASSGMALNTLPPPIIPTLYTAPPRFSGTRSS